jgi:hypothetical protein
MPLANQTNAARSLHHQDMDVPVTAQHIDAHVLLMAGQEQIEGRPSHLEIVNPQLTQGDWQVWTSEIYLRFRAIDFQA